MVEEHTIPEWYIPNGQQYLGEPCSECGQRPPTDLDDKCQQCGGTYVLGDVDIPEGYDSPEAWANNDPEPSEPDFDSTLKRRTVKRSGFMRGHTRTVWVWD